MKHQILFCSGEFLNISLIHRIKDMHTNVGIGVYTDSYFHSVYGRLPLKPYEERANIILALKGVDFVFPFNGETDIFDNGNFIREKPVSQQERFPENKPWNIIYCPGTFDLFHAGHLEHIMMARRQCTTLVVGVNSDDLVLANKGKQTVMRESERLLIIQALSLVDQAFIVRTNDKSFINKIVIENTGYPISAIYLGSDLKGSVLEDNPDAIPIVFTERDPLIMKNRSTSFYKKELDKLKG